MPRQSVPRRTQFSSCDACRLSRVACDASKTGHRSARVGWTGSCSRCNRKRQACTFEWIKHAKANISDPPRNETNSSHMGPPESEEDHEPTLSQPEPARVTRGCRSWRGRRTYERPIAQVSPDTVIPNENHLSGLSYSSLSTESGNNTESAARSGALLIPIGLSEDLLTLWANHIFRHGYETTLGILLGKYGCPFVNDSENDTIIPVTTLVRRLDAKMNDATETPLPPPMTSFEITAPTTDELIEQCLERAIVAFTARWLPLDIRTVDVEDIVTSSWRRARSEMLKILNRVSYRSVLAMYIFAETPVPVGISEDEELSGISGLVCMQTALMYVQKLRQRREPAARPESDLLADATQVFVDLESRAYWAAVMWDTSNSLATNLRTSLTSGLNGACAEPAWRLAKAFLVGSFAPTTEKWLTNGFAVTDDTAARIIGAASVCQVYMWKTIASVNEAVREGVAEDTVLWVWRAFLDSVSIFRKSIRPLLRSCEDCLHFLNQPNRLGWYRVMLQYCLGILRVLDMLEVAKCVDLLQQVLEVRDEVEHESFRVLKFGTGNAYRIPKLVESHFNTTDPRTTSTFSVDFPQRSIVSAYAFPQHVVAIVRLLVLVITRKKGEGRIDGDVYAHLSSILADSLRELPQSSRVAQSAKQCLHGLLDEVCD